MFVYLYVRRKANELKQVIEGINQHILLDSRHIKVLKISLTIVAIFLIMWTPLIALFTMNAFDIISPIWLWNLVFFITTTKCSVHPFVYYMHHINFKNELQHFKSKTKILDIL